MYYLYHFGHIIYLCLSPFLTHETEMTAALSVCHCSEHEMMHSIYRTGQCLPERKWLINVVHNNYSLFMLFPSFLNLADQNIPQTVSTQRSKLRALWRKPVVPATWEAEAGGSRTRPAEAISDFKASLADLGRFCLERNRTKWSYSVAQ